MLTYLTLLWLLLLLALLKLMLLPLLVALILKWATPPLLPEVYSLLDLVIAVGKDIRWKSCSRCIVDKAEVECDEVDDIDIEDEICDVFKRPEPMSSCWCWPACIVELDDDVSVVEYQGFVRMRLLCRGDGATWNGSQIKIRFNLHKILYLETYTQNPLRLE